jgi:hypothetical protein
MAGPRTWRKRRLWNEKQLLKQDIFAEMGLAVGAGAKHVVLTGKTV